MAEKPIQVNDLIAQAETVDETEAAVPVRDDTGRCRVMAGPCCELAALGWGVHPNVASTITTPQDGREVLAVLRDFWRRACPDDRQVLLDTVRAVEWAIKELS